MRWSAAGCCTLAGMKRLRKKSDRRDRRPLGLKPVRSVTNGRMPAGFVHRAGRPPFLPRARQVFPILPCRTVDFIGTISAVVLLSRFLVAEAALLALDRVQCLDVARQQIEAYNFAVLHPDLLEA